MTRPLRAAERYRPTLARPRSSKSLTLFGVRLILVATLGALVLRGTILVFDGGGRRAKLALQVRHPGLDPVELGASLVIQGVQIGQLGHATPLFRLTVAKGAEPRLCCGH